MRHFTSCRAVREFKFQSARVRWALKPMQAQCGEGKNSLMTPFAQPESGLVLEADDHHSLLLSTILKATMPSDP